MAEPLFFEQGGDHAKADVVMIHGLPSSPASMWHVGDALTDVARVTNVHLPGYAKSAPLRPYDEATMLDRLEATLVAAGVKAPIVIGYSSGAYRAFALALRNVRIRGLVILAGLNERSPEHRAQLHANAKVARDPAADVAGLFTPFFLSPQGMQSASFVAEVGTWFTVAAPGDVAAELDVFADLPGLDIAKLKMPALVRVGELDQAAPAALSQQIAAQLPQSVLQVVPGVGHAIMLEDEAGTARAIRDFVASIERRTSRTT